MTRVAGLFTVLLLLAGCEGDIGSTMGSSPPPGLGTGGGSAGSGAGGSGAIGGAGAVGGSGGTAPDPFGAAPTCTSGTMWTQGNHESEDMNPGMACITCHTTMMKGPSLTIGGTVYPTAHEPDLCNGANGASGARVVITGADGQTLTLTPRASGNFNSRTRVMPPYRAKVTYMGRERAMAATQTSGDCNSCHTQTGATGAPGRILLP